MRNLFFITIATLILLGCNKPNPNPELIDPVYLDIKKQREDLEKEIVEAKKTVDEKKQILSEVIPQTGQIKYAEKRLYRAEDTLKKMQQRLEYLKLKEKSRLEYSRSDYSKAWSKGEQWPDPNEFKTYQNIEKMKRKQLIWSNRERLDNYNKERHLGSKQTGGKEPAPEH